SAGGENDRVFHLPLQLRTIRELIQRFRIGQRLPVPDRPPVHDVTDGQFHYLPTLRPWNVEDLDDTRRHVTRRGVGTDVRADSLHEIAIQLQPFAQLD